MRTDFILLPQPQVLDLIGPPFRPASDQLLCIVGCGLPALLFIGKVVQQAMTSFNVYWTLTAARGDDASQLGALLIVDSAQVSRAEGYRLTIRRERIMVVAHDEAGAFYAAMTIRQLARQFASSGALPGLHIDDWPDFPNRGVMLDISRDKVPTMESLYMLIDMLAEWKINQFQLYTEHTFAFRAHRAVWEKASPMTPEQIMQLDAYCQARFIELVPNQNSFGHMERWLKHPEYVDLAIAPEGFTFRGGWHEGPFSINPLDPRSLKLLDGLYSELLPHFSSHQFNVGCDETFDLGQGKTEKDCEARGKGRVYLDFLLQIYDRVTKHGKTMQFWGDIVQNHPELIPELPKDLIALEWGYDADHPFAERTQRLSEAGIPFYVCPSTAGFLSIAGRTDNAVGNLRNAAQSGLAQHALGYLITEWGDEGHWQHFPIALLGFAYGAALSWSTAANSSLDLPTVLDVHAYRDPVGIMGRLAYDLGNAYRETDVLISYRSALSFLLTDPDHPLEGGRLSGLKLESLEHTLEYIDNAMARLTHAKMTRPDSELIAAEFANTAALMRHACHLGIARLKTGDGDIKSIASITRRELASELALIVEDYQRLWLARNRPGGLKDSAGRLQRLVNLYLH